MGDGGRVSGYLPTLRSGNPRNVGSIPDPDGEGLVGSMACGDALKLMFKLDDAERIAALDALGG